MYDFRVGQHFTLKQNPLRCEHLDDFVKCCRPGEPRSTRIETERFRSFTYNELIARDKVNLDIIWLKELIPRGHRLPATAQRDRPEDHRRPGGRPQRVCRDRQGSATDTNEL